MDEYFELNFSSYFKSFLKKNSRKLLTLIFTNPAVCFICALLMNSASWIEHTHRLKCCLSRSSYTRKVFICSLYSEGSVGCFALQHQAVHTCILWDEAFITGLHKDRREVAGFHHLQDDCSGGKLIRVHFLKCLRRQRGNVFGERSTLQNNGSIIIWENER